MENGGKFEQKVVINELLQGYELAKQLRNHLDPASPAESLAHRVLSSFNNALSMIKFFEYGGEPQPTAPNSGTNSPHSVSGSPRSDNSNRSDCGDVSKKRKMLPKWSKKVKVCPTTGMEGPPDDGNSWRKYGQKDILGSKYPRGYYRCTHRFVEGCQAKKQVQKTEEDPTVFHVIYQGTHTCTQSAHQIRRSGSFEIQEQNNNHQQEQQQPLLLNFGADLKLKTADLDCRELNSSTFSFPPTSIAGGNAENCIFSSASFDNQFMGSFSSPFISPATSESNYFTLPPCHMNSYSGVPNMPTPESDLNEIISAVTSASNSPLLDLDFTLEQIDPSLQFDTSSFLS